MKLHAQHRLPVFIALSLAVHLVWFVGQRSWTLHPPQQDNSLMAIHISEPHPPEHTKKSKPDTVKTQDQTPPLTEQTSRHQPPSTQVQPQTSQQQATQLTRARIIGQIKQRLVQYFVYPTLARRQGWQGQVTLGFKVDGAGSIRHIHVKHSSGYAILDDSAVSAMQQVGQVQLDEMGFMDQFWQLEIPIIYRLEG